MRAVDFSVAPADDPEDQRIGTVFLNSPAERPASPGDEVVRFDGKPISRYATISAAGSTEDAGRPSRTEPAAATRSEGRGRIGGRFRMKGLFRNRIEDSHGRQWPPAADGFVDSKNRESPPSLIDIILDPPGPST